MRVAVLERILHEAKAVEGQSRRSWSSRFLRAGGWERRWHRVTALELEVTDRRGPLVEDGGDLVIVVGGDAAGSGRSRSHR